MRYLYYASLLGSIYILHVIMHTTGSCLSRCLTSKKSFSTATFGCVNSVGSVDRLDLFRKVSCFFFQMYLFHLSLHLLHKLLMYYTCYQGMLLRGKFVSIVLIFFKLVLSGKDS